jgi:hypothetical protein
LVCGSQEFISELEYSIQRVELGYSEVDEKTLKEWKFLLSERKKDEGLPF